MFHVPGSARCSRFALAAVMGAGIGLSAQAPAEKVVPVHEEPHHRQLFQHGVVRILDMQIPAGDGSAFHRHDWPVLILGLSSSRTRRQNLGEEWSADAATPTPAPAARSIRPTSTTTYADKPLTHRLENIGTGIARNFIVVNESAGDESMTEQQAGFTAKPELSNKWFRAYRIALSPGERTAAHRHNAPVVLVQVTDGKAVGAGAMTWEFNTPGQWAFFESGDPHAFANTGDARIELIEVEVRTRVGP
jgi:quercetin dioxygenase-like cupin family protein